MAVRTDTAHEEVDATSSLNSLLVILTLFLQVVSIAVKDMNILLLDVDM